MTLTLESVRTSARLLNVIDHFLSDMHSIDTYILSKFITNPEITEKFFNEIHQFFFYIFHLLFLNETKIRKKMKTQTVEQW